MVGYLGSLSESEHGCRLMRACTLSHSLSPPLSLSYTPRSAGGPVEEKLCSVGAVWADGRLGCVLVFVHRAVLGW